MTLGYNKTRKQRRKYSWVNHRLAAYISLSSRMGFVKAIEVCVKVIKDDEKHKEKLSYK